MKDNFKEIIQSEFCRVLQRDPQDNIDDTPISELGIDSLDFFEIILHLEEEFGIKIPIEELDDKVTLRAIIASLDE